MNIENLNPNQDVVFTRTRQSYSIHTIPLAGQHIVCTAAPQLNQEIVVGDVVTWDDQQRITTVLPRHNQFSRRSAGKVYQEQVIAANVDQVLIVMSVVKPRPRWNLLDRYLVSAEFTNIPAVICLTKVDLLRDEEETAEIEAIAAEYHALGYEVILSSTRTSQGIDALRAQIQGRFSVLVGQSGVGKSSLINMLEPGLALRIQDVGRKNEKGRHTTTATQMHPLQIGGFLMDTPGIREFGLWNITPDDLIHAFPEMRSLQHPCKFRDCTHQEEPGCNIRQAVMDGEISPYRYQSYLKLLEE